MLALHLAAEGPGPEPEAGPMRNSVVLGAICFASEMAFPWSFAVWGKGQNILARVEWLCKTFRTSSGPSVEGIGW